MVVGLKCEVQLTFADGSDPDAPPIAIELVSIEATGSGDLPSPQGQARIAAAIVGVITTDNPGA